MVLEVLEVMEDPGVLGGSWKVLEIMNGPRVLGGSCTAIEVIEVLEGPLGVS